MNVEKLCALIIDRTKLESMQLLCPSWCHIDQTIDAYLEEVERKIEEIEENK